MNKKYFIISFLLFFLLSYLVYTLSSIKITVKFNELEPFEHYLPVYYKGFKLGNTTKIYPGEDYKTTMVDLRIVPRDLVLPQNIYAVVRRKDKKDYIELEYPDSPYLANLKNKDVIDGYLGVNFENYIQEQANNGGLDEIKNNVNNTIKSAGETFNALTDMINITSGILEEIRPIIKDSVEKLNVASKELANSSINIRKSLDKGYLDKTLYNFEQTSGNLVVSTHNISGFSESINQKSIRLLNCLITNLNIVVKNVNEIVIGIGNTLRKKMGGLRLVFGKTLN